MKQLRYSSYSNMALCYLKMEDYELVVENCNKVLSLDSSNSKCYYRRGLAYYNMVYIIQISCIIFSMNIHQQLAI